MSFAKAILLYVTLLVSYSAHIHFGAGRQCWYSWRADVTATAREAHFYGVQVFDKVLVLASKLLIYANWLIVYII